MSPPPTATKRVPSAEAATAVQAFVGALVQTQFCAGARQTVPTMATAHIAIHFIFIFLSVNTPGFIPA
jgi:hypothetical protein